jgi:hypothetical protein
MVDSCTLVVDDKTITLNDIISIDIKSGKDGLSDETA